MKTGKAMGPVEVWRSLGEDGIVMLWDLMQKIYTQDKMPVEWRESVAVPVYKEKSDAQRIKSTVPHHERVIDRRLREETSIAAEEQFGFMRGKGTTDETDDGKTHIEKHKKDCT